MWRFLKKLEIELQYIPLLGVHTNETRIERDMCTLMFNEWIRKPWYIYTMEYYSDIKMNAFGSVLMRLMKPEPIMQIEVSQKEEHQYSILV